jgi:hypothetical protein
MDRSELKTGDRVIVTTRADGKTMTRNGMIVGESQSGRAWIVRRDDIAGHFSYDKNFCSPEP